MINTRLTLRKTNAFIFDIDGTLSDTTRRRHHVEKSPKDWNSFFADQINDDVLPTVHILREFHHGANEILLVTGRSEEYKKVTKQWLKKHKLNHTKLFMRTADDRREDTQIKLEIYNSYIKPYYNVLGVFEDRLRLVRMWREQGLFVFNCNQTDAEF
jgi:phosphoglycolate phosphatase-like HAD superfamily hydrolase